MLNKDIKVNIPTWHTILSWNHQERRGCRLALLLSLQQPLLQSEPEKSRNMKTGWQSDWGETYGASDDPPQGVPGPFIKPVEEFVEAVGGEMVRWSVVEPGAQEEKEAMLSKIQNNKNNQGKPAWPQGFLPG